MDNLDNLSAVLYKRQDLRLEQRSTPVPNDNEVLIKIMCVGISKFDIHHYRNQDSTVEEQPPYIIGHEASGIIVQIGKNVTTLTPGDRVAIEPSYGCRTACSYCKSGRYNLCPDIIIHGISSHNGYLTRYVCHPADCCFKLPDHVSFEEGAMVESLSRGIHACRMSHVSIADRVLILGVDTIGLVTVITARAMGATKIICIDVSDYKLTKAKELGATHIINTNNFDDQIQEHIKMLFDGELPNKTIDCIGSQASLCLGLQVTRRAGVLCVAGFDAPEVTVPLTSALRRGVDVRGVSGYCNDYPIALEMVDIGKANVKSLITDHYRLEETLEAIETACISREGVIKIMIHCDENYNKSIQ